MSETAAVAFWNTRADLPRTTVDATDILDDERVDKELRRWQDAIRDKMIDMGVPDSLINWVECNSGDPLDFTLAEVGQGLGYFIDKLEAVSTPRATEGELTPLTDKEVRLLTDYHYYEAEKAITRRGDRASEQRHLERLHELRTWAKSRDSKGEES